MQYIDYVKEKIANKKVCFYPMGIAAKSLLTKLETYGIEADFFSDRNSDLWGSEFKGKPCISKLQLSEMCQDNVVVIIESLYYKEIKEDLQESGIKNIIRLYPEKFATDAYMEKHGDDELQEKVEEVLSICEDEKSKQVFKYLVDFWKNNYNSDNYFEAVYEKNQYFDSEIINISDDEVFVDVGAYIGDTMEKFLDFCGYRFERMHLFELDKQIYKRLEENIKKLGNEVNKRIWSYPYGLSDKNGSVCFTSGDSSSSISSKGGDIIGTIKRMDDILKGERVTFIKMDIEGAETAALRGAEEIIKKQRPKLAVCIYHSPEDMLNIPVYLKKLVPEYKIYIRHYTDMMLETVCYATID